MVGDYIFSPTVYNEFSPGNRGTKSWDVRGAAEFPLGGLTFMAGADWRNWAYQTASGPVSPCPEAGCVTVIGGGGQTFVPTFQAYETDVDARLGIKVLNPRVYIAGSYLWQQNNYGYPQLNGWGFGAEKLPDLNEPLTVYGSIYYYPKIQGTAGPFVLAYRMYRYNIGLNWNFLGPSFPVYFDIGFLSNYETNFSNAPSNVNKYGGYAGFGIHF